VEQPIDASAVTTATAGTKSLTDNSRVTRASEIDGGNAVAAVMVGVDCGRSGAVSPAGDPVPFPERVSAFPSSGKGTGSRACDTLDAQNRRTRRRLSRS